MSAVLQVGIIWVPARDTLVIWQWSHANDVRREFVVDKVCSVSPLNLDL